MATSNHITKVAIAGAGGNSGRFMTEALLKTGKHSVTAITRTYSENTFPEGVTTKKVDYDKPETVIEALKGHDALVIALSSQIPDETHTQLVQAAGEAGVPWILPNEWAPDTANEALVEDLFVFKQKTAIRKVIADIGKSSYIAVATGFWYEYTLAIPDVLGIDLANRTASLFDDGDTKISMSTFSQVGRAVAALLSLPIKSGGSNKETCLENFKGKVVYVNSFTVSQRDILESVLRVTGREASDWTVTKEPSEGRYAAALNEIQNGKPTGFPKMLGSRVLYPDGSGDFEHTRGTLNGMLGLPKEDLDKVTKAAIEGF